MYKPLDLRRQGGKYHVKGLLESSFSGFGRVGCDGPFLRISLDLLRLSGVTDRLWPLRGAP